MEKRRRLWTVEELAEFLQVPAKTIYSWRYRGEGPLGIRVGKHVRFEEAEVTRWLESRGDARPAT